MRQLIFLVYHRLVLCVCAFFFFAATCFCVANEKTKLALIIVINHWNAKCIVRALCARYDLPCLIEEGFGCFTMHSTEHALSYSPGLSELSRKAKIS